MRALRDHIYKVRTSLGEWKHVITIVGHNPKYASSCDGRIRVVLSVGMTRMTDNTLIPRASVDMQNPSCMLGPISKKRVWSSYEWRSEYASYVSPSEQNFKTLCELAERVGTPTSEKTAPTSKELIEAWLEVVDTRPRWRDTYRPIRQRIGFAHAQVGEVMVTEHFTDYERSWVVADAPHHVHVPTTIAV